MRLVSINIALISVWLSEAMRTLLFQAKIPQATINVWSLLAKWARLTSKTQRSSPASEEPQSYWMFQGKSLFLTELHDMVHLANNEGGICSRFLLIFPVWIYKPMAWLPSYLRTFGWALLKALWVLRNHFKHYMPFKRANSYKVTGLKTTTWYWLVCFDLGYIKIGGPFNLFDCSLHSCPNGVPFTLRQSSSSG